MDQPNLLTSGANWSVETLLAEGERQSYLLHDDSVPALLAKLQCVSIMQWGGATHAVVCVTPTEAKALRLPWRHLHTFDAYCNIFRRLKETKAEQHSRWEDYTVHECSRIADLIILSAGLEEARAERRELRGNLLKIVFAQARGEERVLKSFDYHPELLQAIEGEAATRTAAALDHQQHPNFASFVGAIDRWCDDIFDHAHHIRELSRSPQRPHLQPAVHSQKPLAHEHTHPTVSRRSSAALARVTVAIWKVQRTVAAMLRRRHTSRISYSGVLTAPEWPAVQVASGLGWARGDCNEGGTNRAVVRIAEPYAKNSSAVLRYVAHEVGHHLFPFATPQLQIQRETSAPFRRTFNAWRREQIAAACTYPTTTWVANWVRYFSAYPGINARRHYRIKSRRFGCAYPEVLRKSGGLDGQRLLGFNEFVAEAFGIYVAVQTTTTPNSNSREARRTSTFAAVYPTSFEYFLRDVCGHSKRQAQRLLAAAPPSLTSAPLARRSSTIAMKPRPAACWSGKPLFTVAP